MSEAFLARWYIGGGYMDVSEVVVLMIMFLKWLYFSMPSARNIPSVKARLNGSDIRADWGCGEIWTPTNCLSVRGYKHQLLTA